MGAALTLYDKKVLAVDMDPQANLTTHLGVDKGELERTIYHALLGREILSNIIMKTEVEGLALVPSNISLAGAEIELQPMAGREYFLREALEPIKEEYDYVLVDTPPSLGLLTLNSIVASNSIIIPIQAHYYALEGIGSLLNVIKLARSRLRTSTELKGVLVTLFDQRTRLAWEVQEQVKAHFKDTIFKTLIPRNVRLAEAPSHGKPILLYDSKCAGAQAYEALAKEIIEMEVSQ